MNKSIILTVSKSRLGSVGNADDYERVARNERRTTFYYFQLTFVMRVTERRDILQHTWGPGANRLVKNTALCIQYIYIYFRFLSKVILDFWSVGESLTR